MDTDPFGISKTKPLKNEPKATGGRKAAATVFGSLHGVTAGKKGKKLKAGGIALGTTIGGSVVGGALGAATRSPALASLGSTAGAYGGSYAGFKHNNKRGYYKKQIKKSDAESAFGVEH